MLKLLGPYRWLIAAGVVLALLAAIYAKGHHDGKSSELRAQASRLEKARKAVARKEVAATKITEKVATQLQAERVRIEYRTKTLIERIPADAPPGRPSLPGWFVSLHDSAVLGLSEAPGSTVSPDQSASGVTDAEALKVIIPNYGVCHEALARNAAWESWYGQLRETYNR